MSEFKAFIEKHRDWFLDFVRMFIGVVLILKGIFFLNDMSAIMEATNQEFQSELSTGWAYGTLAHFIILAHIVGGAFLTIGLLTRVVIPFQFPILLIAAVAAPISKVYFRGSAPFEAAMLIVFLILLLLFGDGRLSVDYYLERKKNR